MGVLARVIDRRAAGERSLQRVDSTIRCISFEGPLQSIRVRRHERCLLIDRQTVQDRLSPSTYRPWQLKRIRHKFDLAPSAVVVLWPEDGIRLDLSFAAELAGAPSEIEVDVQVRLAVVESALARAASALRGNLDQAVVAAVEKALRFGISGGLAGSIDPLHLDPHVAHQCRALLLEAWRASWSIEWLRPAAIESLDLWINPFGAWRTTTEMTISGESLNASDGGTERRLEFLGIGPPGPRGWANFSVNRKHHRIKCGRWESLPLGGWRLPIRCVADRPGVAKVEIGRASQGRTNEPRGL